MDENFLCCSICLGFLDEPITILCGHSFCMACITKYYEMGGKSCPECRLPLPAPRLIAVNVSLRDIVENYRNILEGEGKNQSVNKVEPKVKSKAKEVDSLPLESGEEELPAVTERQGGGLGKEAPETEPDFRQRHAEELFQDAEALFFHSESTSAPKSRYAPKFLPWTSADTDTVSHVHSVATNLGVSQALLRLAADWGHPRALAVLGLRHVWGAGGVTRSFTKAREYFRKAAEADDPLGQAICLLQRIGGPQSEPNSRRGSVTLPGNSVPVAPPTSSTAPRQDQGSARSALSALAAAAFAAFSSHSRNHSSNNNNNDNNNDDGASAAVDPASPVDPVPQVPTSTEPAADQDETTGAPSADPVADGETTEPPVPDSLLNFRPDVDCKEMGFMLLSRLAEVDHDPHAETVVAECFRHGDGVGKDASKAQEWYLKASGRGHPIACYGLGDLHLGESLGRRDASEAARWYLKAARGGYARAQFMVGNRFYKGDGVTKDNRKAFRWFMCAAEEGHPGAQHNLANRYYFGEGVTFSLTDAIAWYKKAAAQGFELSIKALHDLQNAGVPVDNPPASEQQGTPTAVPT